MPAQPSEVLQRRILLFASAAVVITGLVVSVVGMLPLALYTRQLAAEKVEHARTVTAQAVAEHVHSLTSVARQVASRTQIRLTIEQYLDGKVSRDDMVSFLTPRLRDAMQTTPELLGILRLGPDGAPLVGVGQEPPPALHPPPGAWHQASPAAPPLVGPLLTPQGLRLVAGMPLSREDGRPLGVDLTLFNAEPLAALLSPQNGNILEMKVFLALPGPQGPRWLHRDNGAVGEQAPPVSVETGSHGTRVEEDPSGRVWVVATGPVPGTPWTLAVLAPGRAVFGEALNHVIGALIATLALALSGAGVLFLLLRPLAGHVLIRHRELHDQVAALRSMSQSLEDERRRLAESNHELEEFASAASHDLQQPLRMITGFLDLLRRRYGERLDDEGREYLSYAYDGAHRLSRMVRGLLDYARTGRGPGRIEQVALADLVAQANANLQSALSDAGGCVHCEIPADLSVRGEPTLLLRLFQNLIDNALKYRHPTRPAQVRIFARLMEGQEADPDAPHKVEVVVRDNGIGVPGDQMQRIFQLFHRLNPDSGPEGTGLGLALCQKIVTLHGGNIWGAHAPNTAAWGGGLEIHFTLPVG